MAASMERLGTPPLPPPVSPAPAVTPVTTFVVSRFTVTLPDVPPPVSPVPAVTPLIVFGNVWLAEKVTGPVKLALPCTSSVNAGAVVPMPTFVLDPEPFTPAMLPSTSELLAVTVARAPIAVELLSAG